MSDRRSDEGAGGEAGGGVILKAATGQRGSALLLVVVFLAAAAFSFLYFYNRSVKTNLSNPKTIEQKASVDGEAPSASSALPEAVRENLISADEAFVRGDLYKALTLYRLALKDAQDSPEIKRYLAKALNAAAMKDYESGDFERAHLMLKEAVGLENNREYSANLFKVLKKLKKIEEDAFVLDTVSSKEIRALGGNKADLSSGPGQGQGGVEEKAAGDAQAEQKRWAPPKTAKDVSVESRMGTKEGGHFTVRFEGGENAATGHLVGLLLEEAYLKVGSDLNFYPEDRIEALLYTRETFRDVTRTPSWAGALYDGRIKIPAGGIYEKTAELEKVIFHEYTHVVVHRLSGGRAPVWLNEGIAQHEEGRASADYGEYLKNVALSGKVRLKSLEGSFMRLDSKSAAAAYLLSLSATEYIIREFGIFSVRRILDNISKGGSTEEAIRSALYLSYEDLEKSWLGSLNR